MSIKYKGYTINENWLNEITITDSSGYVIFKALSVDAAKEYINDLA